MQAIKSIITMFLGSIFSQNAMALAVMPAIPIYDERTVPNLEGFEEMHGYAIDAYPYQHGTNTFGSGDVSGNVEELAVRTVASHFNISDQEAIDRFDICIVPGIGFHGRIMAKQKM